MRAAILAILAACCAGAGEKKPDAPAAASLTTMTRVFVDRFGGGETAAQLRDMIISSLGQSRLVQITENEERADVVLRGSGEDLVFTDQHQFADGLNVHANSASSSRNILNAESTGAGIGVGENQSGKTSERRHEATASVRLVNRDGDVIWTATKESLGGKFRSASADVADKIMKQLVQDVEKARASSSMQAAKPSR